MALEFTTAKRSTDPITFTYDSRKITFNPPKQAVMMMPMMDTERGTKSISNMTTVLIWFEEGLSEKDAKWFEDRLRDPKDDLDVDDIDEVVSKLLEEIAGRPTT